MKKLLVLAGLLSLFAVPAAVADSANGSTEHRQACIDDATGQEVPRNADGTCPLGSTDTTVYENNVTCGTPDADGGDVPDVDGPAGNVYTTGDPAAQSGGIEVCADGSDEVTVVEGRVIAEGSAADGGYVAADGDQDNASVDPALAGWARVDVDSGGATVRCGDDAGNLDATHPGPEDGQDDCG